jgi:membrane protein
LASLICAGPDAGFVMSDGLEHAREKTPAMRPRNGDGHGAVKPQEIPRPGWKAIGGRVMNRISADNLSVIAAGVAFYAFLAIPSALTALVVLYGLIANTSDVQHQVSLMAGVVPKDALNLIVRQLKAVTSTSNSTLGISLVVAVFLAIWGSRSGMSTLISALNIANAEPEKRSFIRFQFAALGLTAGAIVFAVISLALIAVLPAVIDFLPFGHFGKTVAAVIRWPVLLAIVVVGLAAIYRYGPCRSEPRWRWVSWGATIATVLWLAGCALFSVYVGEFANYNKSYGSLGAVVALMMWLYLSAFLVLLGAVLNAEMEHQTARDTTTGPEEPMGRRGAKMADTVARD